MSAITLHRFGHAHCFVADKDEENGHALTELVRTLDVIAVKGKNVIEPDATESRYRVFLNVEAATPEEIATLKVKIVETNNDDGKKEKEGKVENDLTVTHTLEAEHDVRQIDITVYPEGKEQNYAKATTHARPIEPGEVTNLSIDNNAQTYTPTATADEEVKVRADANITDGTPIPLELTLISKSGSSQTLTLEETVQNTEINRTLTMEEIAKLGNMEVSDLKEVQATLNHEGANLTSNTTKVTRTLVAKLWTDDVTLNDVAEEKEKKVYKKGKNGKPNSKGDEVKLIQKALKQMDIDIGKSGVDGDYGKDGHNAVWLFQESYEPTHETHEYTWSKPDGVVGKNTLLAMDEALVAGWKYKEPDYKKAPWMPFALAEFEKHKGLKEKDTLLNASIKKYHETTNAKSYFSKHAPNYYEISWCASFVSWCFSQTSEYKNPNSGYCALAHDWAPVASKKVKSNLYADGWKEGEKCEAFYGAVVVLDFAHIAFIVGLNQYGNRYIYLGGNQGSNIEGESVLSYGSVAIGSEHAIMKPKNYLVSDDEKKLPKLKLNAKGESYETTR